MMLIGLVLVLSIFALGVLGNEGLGWFASNDKVTADDMSITVNGEFDIVKSVEYFAIESVSLDGVINIYTFKDQLAEGAPKSLGQFSTLVAERQILIKITLNDNVGAVRVTAESAVSEYIADETPTVSKTGNSLSSVVEFYSISGKYVTCDEESVEYVVSSDHFHEGSASRFSTVTVGENGVSTSFDQIISLYATEDGTDEDVIYIVVDYYEDAAEHVIDIANELIDFGEDLEKIITFAPDFKITVAKIA